MPDSEQLQNNSDLIESIASLEKRIAEQNQLLAQHVQNQTNIRSRVVAGLWTGLGTVLGATVMVSVIVIALKPLANVQWISPIVKKVIDDLETRSPNLRSPQANR